MKKLFTLLFVVLATLTANAADIYLRGSSIGKDWAAIDAAKFTDNGDETYTLNYKGTITGSFKVADANWGAINYGAAQGKATVVFDTPMACVHNSSENFMVDGGLEDPTFIFDLKNKTLTCKAKQVAVATPPIYLRGAAIDPNWAALETAKFTDNGDNTFTLNWVGTLVGNFKIADANWGTINYGAQAGLNNVVLGTPMGCVYDSQIGFNAETPIVNPTLVFNLTDKTLTITTTSTDVPVVEYDYYIHGTVFGVATWASYKMNKEGNGTYTYTDKNWVAGGFGIKKCLAGDTGQIAWIAAKGDNVLSEMNLSTALECVENGKNFDCQLVGDYMLTFDPEKMTVTASSTTGVADVEVANGSAVYYNLQGVKVARENAAPGLYIVRQNGKATKVLVK